MEGAPGRPRRPPAPSRHAQDSHGREAIMPIRFRCAYCNQLMGMARRKAGTIVRCPKCAGEVIVPALPEPQAANGPGRLDRQLLEADDFGKEFADLDSVPEALPNPLPPPPYGHDAPPQNQPAAGAPARADTPTADTSMSGSVTRAGVYLNVPMLISAGVGLLALIGVTFLLGFFLGRSTVL